LGGGGSPLELKNEMWKEGPCSFFGKKEPKKRDEPGAWSCPPLKSIVRGRRDGRERFQKSGEETQWGTKSISFGQKGDRKIGKVRGQGGRKKKAPVGIPKRQEKDRRRMIEIILKREVKGDYTYCRDRARLGKIQPRKTT